MVKRTGPQTLELKELIRDLKILGNKEKINYPIKLIYDSWSSNIKKGFNYLKFLDENLDFLLIFKIYRDFICHQPKSIV